MNRFSRFIIVIVSIAALTGVAVAQTDTTFTYQGELKDGGTLASGSFAMDLSLWDAVSGGSQIGSTQSFAAVSVSDGIFTVELDFGADAFNNDGRWLEIVIDGTPLSPRQPITRTPYAIQTRGMVIGDDGNVTFNSLSAVEGTATIISPGGIDLILDADTNNSGEDQNARMVLRQDGGQVAGRIGYREGANKLEVMQEFADDLILGSNNQDSVWIKPDGFVGVGRAAEVNFLEAFGVHSPADTEFGGMYVSTEGEGALPFYGYAAGQTSDMLCYYDGSTGSWHVHNGGADRLTVTDFGEVGIGSSSANGYLKITTDCGPVAGLTVDNACPEALGIIGRSSAPSGPASTGVLGWANAPGARGVKGQSTAVTGSGVGVEGTSSSTSGFDFFASGVGTNFGSSSSIRWKKNIEVIDDPLYKLSKLRGVYFDWDKDHGGHHDVGMIAEEVGMVLPVIVQYEENGIDAIGMDYSKLTPLLVEAVNALRAKNKAEIAALSTSNDTLEAHLLEQESATQRHQQELAALADENDRMRERLAEMELKVESLQARMRE